MSFAKPVLVNGTLLVAICASACASCKSGAAPPDSASPASPSGPPSDGDASAGSSVASVALSGGAGGSGFDDLIFAPGLRKIVAPAGATGNLDLIDPDSFTVASISGFSAAQRQFRGGHGDGTTSADEGRGLLFAIDRTSMLLDVVDPKAKIIVASAKLGGSPDYVRWVDATSELWVTEPDSERIEVFRVPAGAKPTPTHAMNIAIKGGPESLVIDATRRKAFTHLWKGETVVVDIPTHALVATWPNGCGGSRGIAIDVARGFVFAGCAEGKAVALDVNHDGKQVGSVSAGSGVDVIAYSPELGHLYVPGASSATMAIVGVAASGGLSVLGTVPTSDGAHCVAADDRGHAWVCDPAGGRLLAVKDAFAKP
jgi:hypothetical protein